jgi:LysM repeat protein
MWAGAPAPTRPAGSRACELRTDACSPILAPFRGAPRRAPALLSASPAPQRGRAGAAVPPAAAAGKDAVPPMVSYTVQKGEKLWDIAVQHGVSMRTIKDLNKLPGSEPVLSEGQQLLVPASGITAVAAVDGATSAAALGSTPARGLWGESPPPLVLPLPPLLVLLLVLLALLQVLAAQVLHCRTAPTSSSPPLFSHHPTPA